MPFKITDQSDDYYVAESTADEILLCDECGLPITDRQNGMDLALSQLYWLNAGIYDKYCYDTIHRPRVEYGSSPVKLLKVFNKGQDVSEVRNHVTLQMNVFCEKCETMNIVDSLIDRKDKLPETFTCRACGNVIEKPFGDKGVPKNDREQV